jgi:electron transport complex protein RnfB
MKESETVFRDLRKHLDRQAVGFPATKSGAEIRILKRLFSPEEARLAMHLSYQPRSAKEVFEVVKPEGLSLDDIQKALDEMTSKGAIGRKLKESTYYYHTMPFVLGIYEWQLGKLTPEFLTDIDQFLVTRISDYPC